MRLRLVLTLSVLLAIDLSLSAQNEFYFNQFATIRYLSNPSELSFSNNNGIYLFRRDQWLNSPVKSSHVSILSGQYNLNRNVDLGLALTQYNSGNVFSNNTFQALASWKGRIDKRSNRYFSIGANLKFGSSKADFTNALLTDLNDPSIPQTVIGQSFWDIGIGGNFKYDGFNFGISANSLKAFNENYTSNYIFSRSILYNIGYNFNEALNAKSVNRPILMFRVRAVDNAFAQGELIIDQRIFSNTAYKLIAGVGIRRDLTNGMYNSFIMHLGIFWGTKTRLTLGFGPETYTAPVNTASSGNMEYLFGAEQTSKTDLFYGHYNKGKAKLYDFNWTEARKEFEAANSVYATDKDVDEKMSLTDELEKSWNSINVYYTSARDNYNNQNTSQAKEQCELAKKELDQFAIKSTNNVNVQNIEKRKIELDVLLLQNAQLATAIDQYHSAEALFEQKKYKEAAALFNQVSIFYNTEGCEEYIKKCSTGIELDEEQKRKSEAMDLEFAIIDAYLSSNFTLCIKLADEYLGKYQYNTESVLDTKNKSINAIAEAKRLQIIEQRKEYYSKAKKLESTDDFKGAVTEIKKSLEDDPNCDSCATYLASLESKLLIQNENEYQKHIEKGDYYFSIRAYKQARTEYTKALEIFERDEVLDKIEDCEIQMGGVSNPSSGGMQSVFNKSSKAIVLFVAIDSQGKNSSQGTGFIIRPDGTGITNYHVIEGTSILFAVTHDKKTLDVKVIDYNKDEDWVIFKIIPETEMTFPVIKISNQTPQIGDKVYSIGYPLAFAVGEFTNQLEPTISEGVVNSQTTSRLIPNSCEINHGNSGGPLLNAKGEVVGVTTWGLKADESGNLKYAINIQSLPQKYIR